MEPRATTPHNPVVNWATADVPCELHAGWKRLPRHLHAEIECGTMICDQGLLTMRTRQPKTWDFHTSMLLGMLMLIAFAASRALKGR